MLVCALKVIGTWIVLLILETNLVGFVVRGLLSEGVPSPPDDSSPARVVLVPFVRRIRRLNIMVTTLAGIASVALFVCLYRYWGGALAVLAGAMIMLARLPDLLREIRTGQRGLRGSALAEYTTTVLAWGALPLLWIALCSYSS